MYHIRSVKNNLSRTGKGLRFYPTCKLIYWQRRGDSWIRNKQLLLLTAQVSCLHQFLLFHMSHMMTQRGSNGCEPQLRNPKLREPESFIMGNHYACPLPHWEKLLLYQMVNKSTLSRGLRSLSSEAVCLEQRLMNVFAHNMFKKKRHMENCLPPLFIKRFSPAIPNNILLVGLIG